MTDSLPSTSSNFRLFLLPFSLLTVIISSLYINVSAVTFPSGRRLPPRLPSHILESRLFHLTHDHQLHGPDIQFNLRTVINNGTIINVPPLPSMPWLEPPTVRSAIGFTTVSLNGNVLAIWGRGFSLTPLDKRKYPGLFIHNPIGQTIEVPIKTGSQLKFQNDMTTTTSNERDSSLNIFSKQESNKDECLNKKVEKQVEVAIAFDNKLCKQFGNNKLETISTIRGALSVANQPYKKQTCLSLQLVHIDGECSQTKDPYSAFHELNSKLILDAFKDYWNSKKKRVHRDLTIFLPGFSDKSTISGVAFMGAACNSVYSYAWAENLEPLVMAHEIGHLLNADHSITGLMKPTWNRKDPLQFSQLSIEQISNFIDRNMASKCVETVPLKDNPSQSPTSTPSPSKLKPSGSSTPTPSPSKPKPSRSSTPTPSSSSSSSSNPSPSLSSPPSVSVSSLPSISVSPIPTISITPSSSATYIPSVSTSASMLISPSISLTSSPSLIQMPSELPSSSLSPTSSVLSSPSPSPSLSFSPSNSADPRLPERSIIPPSEQSPSNSEPATPAGVRTCETEYARWNAFKCTLPINVGKIRVRINNIEEGSKFRLINVRVRQEHSSFAILYRSESNDTWIQSLGLHMSPQNTFLSDMTISVTKTYSNRRKFIKFIEKSSNIIIPFENVRTCCRKRLFIYSNITICIKNSICESTTSKLSHVVRCLKCRKPKNFLPSSTSRKCPNCSNAPS